MLRLPCLADESRPLPNVRARTRSEKMEGWVPITRESARKAVLDARKKNAPGLLFAPAACEDLSTWLSEWPHVWRVPSRQHCDKEARKYVFEALVESSFVPGEYTKLHVNYVDKKAMNDKERKVLGDVRRACKLVNEVSSVHVL